MGKKLNDERERVRQTSVGFRQRQLDFFKEHPEFNKDKFIREKLDELFTKAYPEYLSTEHEKTTQ